MSDIPEFDDPEMVFGARSSCFVSKEDGYELELKFRKEADVANSLFALGGRLENYGLTIKPDIDSNKVYRALKALLGSWNPSHEAKIGTVARYLHEWCDPCEPVAKKVEAELESKPKTKKAKP